MTDTPMEFAPDSFAMKSEDRNFYIGASTCIGAVAGLITPLPLAAMVGPMTDFTNLYSSGAVIGVGSSLLATAGIAIQASRHKNDLPRYLWIASIATAAVGAAIGCAEKSVRLKALENKMLSEPTAKVVYLEEIPAPKVPANAYVFQ